MRARRSVVVTPLGLNCGMIATGNHGYFRFAARSTTLGFALAVVIEGFFSWCVIGQQCRRIIRARRSVIVTPLGIARFRFCGCGRKLF